MMITLNEDQVRRITVVDEVIAAIRSAFARDFHSTLKMPVRTILDLEDGGVLLLMPCYDSALGAAGVKTVTVTKQRGVSAAYELLDPADGGILARMEANWLTDLRTAATSAVATDLLARRDAEALAIFGSGRQARAHLAILLRVREFRRFLVCGRSDVRSFCSEMQKEHGIDIEAADAEKCVRGADVICTCTTSKSPLFEGKWLKPGTHLNLVGAFQPEAREVNDETVQRSRVVIDTYEGALAEAGDLLIPLRNGTITRDHIAADLHEIASGKKQGRMSDDQITLFKSVGCALEDLVTAQLIYRRATA